MSKTYVATKDLFIGATKAHAKGSVVPEEAVKQWGWEDSVASEGTKAAASAKDSADK